ncbi:hypothetical protein A2U01_0021988, partial [Trifolium medium]|nr:hypothetical protein [Trifolium medium]
FPRLLPKLDQNFQKQPKNTTNDRRQQTTIPEHVAENNLKTEYGPPHPEDGAFASVTGDNDEQIHEPYVPSDPLVIPLVQPGAPMETIMAALVNAINR